jgi:hypothetical protein
MKTSLIALIILTYKFSFSQININELQKAVVKIYCYDHNNQLQGTGSGVIISADGQIITNWHLFDDYNTYKTIVELWDGSKCELDYFNYILKEQDLIQFKIKNYPNILNYLSISNDPVKIGDQIYTIGSPKGIRNIYNEGKITGILSEKNRIYFDATIDHGSSGGALINKKGQLIGITSGGIDSRVDLNYAKMSNLINLMSPINISRFYDNSLIEGYLNFRIIGDIISDNPFYIFINGRYHYSFNKSGVIGPIKLKQGNHFITIETSYDNRKESARYNLYIKPFETENITFTFKETENSKNRRDDYIKKQQRKDKLEKYLGKRRSNVIQINSIGYNYIDAKDTFKNTFSEIIQISYEKMFKQRSSIEFGISFGFIQPFLIYNNESFYNNYARTNFTAKLAYKFYFGKDLFKKIRSNVYLDKYLVQDIPRNFYLSPSTFYGNYSNVKTISNNSIGLSLGVGYQNNLRAIFLPNFAYKFEYSFGISYSKQITTNNFFTMGAGLLF